MDAGKSQALHSLIEDLQSAADTLNHIAAQEYQFDLNDFVQGGSAGGDWQGIILDRTEEGSFSERIRTEDGESADVTVEGSPENPAYLVRSMQEREDGWIPGTARMAHREESMERWDISQDEIAELPDEASHSDTSDDPGQEDQDDLEGRFSGVEGSDPFHASLEAQAEPQADADGLRGIIWAEGKHDLWVNGEPTSVHVPEETIPDTFQRLQDRMASEGVKIGFDHPDQDSVAAQTALGEIGEVQDVVQATEEGREVIAMRDSQFTNSKAVEAAEAGEFAGMGFSIVGSIALAQNDGQSIERDDGSLEVAAVDIQRVDVVPEQAVEQAQIGNLPEMASAAAAAGRLAADSPNQAAKGFVRTLRAAANSVSAANRPLQAAVDQAVQSLNMDRSDAIQAMATSAGIEPDTVRRIVNSGRIDCPPQDVLEGFASALEVPSEELIDAAEAGGCAYGEAEQPEANDHMTNQDNADGDSFITDPEDLDAAQSALSQASDVVEAKDEQIQELEAKVADLKDQAQHFEEIAASHGIDLSEDDVSAQDVVDAHTEDLRKEIAELEAALPAYDLSEEDQEDRTEELAGSSISELKSTAGERWREHGKAVSKQSELSAAVAADESVGSVGSASGSDGDADEAAQEVMTARELMQASDSGQSPAEFVQAEYGINPEDYDNPGELQSKITGGAN